MDAARALVVGIAAYEHVDALGPSVTKDAQDVRDLLVDPARCAYPPSGVTLLLDGEATRDAILAALADLGKAGVEGPVFIYFSCHGARAMSGDGSSEAYLMPVDGRWGTDAELEETAISGRQLEAALGAITAAKVLVSFDCCHSGGLAQAKGPGGGIKPALPAAYVERLNSGRGRVTVASSREDEVSLVLAGASNSLFTSHLLEALGGAAASPDGFVYISVVFRYVSEAVALAKKAQHPQFTASYEQDFAVAVGRYVEPESAKGLSRRPWDVYVSCADEDEDWVYDTLAPRLRDAGIKVGTADELHDLGVPRLTNMERAMEQAERTVVVLTDAYLQESWSAFEGGLGKAITVEEQLARLMLVSPKPVTGRIPAMYLENEVLELTDGVKPRHWARLADQLRRPVPTTRN